MSGPRCNYHPERAARWRCNHCRTELCGECRVAPQAVGHQPTCPACERELRSLGVEHAITPFWQRMPSLFAYPFHAAPLMTMTLLALATLFALVPFPFLPLVVFGAIWFAFYRMAYAALQLTAHGDLEPPATQSMDAGTAVVWKQLGLFVASAFVIGIAMATLGEGFALVLGIVFLFAMPAVIMRLAITESFVQAINPLAWLEIILRTGGAYFILLIFTYLLTGGVGAVQALLVTAGLPIVVVLPAATFARMYFLLITFHLIGYFLYQYHERLGLDLPEDVVDRNLSADVEKQSAAPGAGNPAVPAESPLLGRVRILLQEGKTEEAAERLVQKLRSEGGSEAEHDQYRRLLDLLGDQTQLLRHGKAYISILLERNRSARAAAVAAECLKLDSAFEPEDPAQVAILARAAESAGHWRQALQLTNAFAKRHPGHPDIPANYFLAARLLSEQMHRDDQARKVLHGLLKKHPEHELAPQMRQYLDVLERLGQTRPA